MQNVAIIGAGPAALYAAEKLLKSGKKVTMFNRDIKPGGLAEFGIYPNKYKMKSGLRKVFTRILTHPNLTYFGNVMVGKTGLVTLEDIASLGFDAVVVAVGAQGTKWLGLPGEEATGVYHAKDLVYHYNALPPFSERDFAMGKKVCVVGIGNVSLDIVHWLVCDKKVEEVTIVARRGPGERAYTNKEMDIVAGALDLDEIRGEFARIADQVRRVGQDPDAYLKELVEQSAEPLECETPTRLKIRYLRSPSAIDKDSSGRVAGLICEVTELVLKGDSVGVRGTGEHETLECDTVVFAIGDSIEPGIGLPIAESGKTFAVDPRPWDAHPDRERYMVWNPDAQAPLWGTFVVGWARKASDGLVGKARLDATTGCDEILAWLDGEFEQAPRGGELQDPRELLRSRGCDFVEYEDVQRLEAEEAKRATELGVPEFKYSSTAKMLEIIKGKS